MWGHPVRAQLYVFIKENPGLYFGEIYEGFLPLATEITGQGFPQASLNRALTSLKDAAVIATDPPPERLRRGRPPRYYPVVEEADALIDAVAEDIFRKRSSPKS